MNGGGGGRKYNYYQVVHFVKTEKRGYLLPGKDSYISTL